MPSMKTYIDLLERLQSVNVRNAYFDCRGRLRQRASCAGSAL